MSRFNESLDLAVSSAGAAPSWLTPSGTGGAPTGPTSGVVLGDGDGRVLKALVLVDLRADAHRRKCTLSVSNYDTVANYTVTIAGTGVTVVGADHATAAELLTDLRDAINANGTLAPLVTASALDASGVDVVVSGGVATQLQIVGDTDADYTIAATATGSGTWQIVAEPMTAKVRAWAAAAGIAPPASWRKAAAWSSVDRAGLVERLDTAGLSRLHVEVYDLAGSGDGVGVTYSVARVRVGPSLLT